MLAMAQGSLDSDRLSSAGLSSHGSTVGESVAGRDEPKRPEDEYALGPLPPMWEKAYTPSGEAYFIDHNTGTSHWLDPRLARVRKRSLGECAEDELPFGWERVTDDRYGAYYVDHINRRTQYENPVLQATRLRAEKMTHEGGGGEGGSGAGGGGGELRGERFTVTLSKGAQGLGFTLIGGADVPGGETAGYLQVRSVVPHSPAWIDGALRPGDVLMGVGRRGVRGATHAQVAQLFQSIPAGSRVTLLLCRGYPLAFDSEDPHTRVLSTLAVDAAPPAPAPAAPSDAVAMQHLTHALRTRFNLESPGRAGGSHDEPDHSPAPHSPGQRRMMSRSFDLEELGEGTEQNVAPRCPSADHLLTHTGSDGAEGASGGGEGGAGRELSLALRRGAAGFGFTIADSVHGQKVKKVLDRSRCAGLREGDLLLQIGETDVRHAPHLRVVQVLKECPALHETTLRVWRRAAAAPRSRSATRLHAPGGGVQLGRSKTPTAEQLRSPALHTVDPLHNRLNGEATYAVPEQRRESLAERRRRSSTPGGLAAAPAQPWAATWPDGRPDEPRPSLDRPQPNPDRARWPDAWLDNATNVRSWAENNSRNWDGVNSPRWSGGGGEGWGEVGTPTVRVDTDSYWRGNASAADSSDNGGFPEEGVLTAPTTAAMGAQPPHDADSARLRTRSPSTNSGGRMRSHSPSNNSSSGRLLAHSPAGAAAAPRRPPSPSCFTCHTSGGADSPAAPPHPPAALYPQVEGAGGADPEADVLVRLAPGAAGFGFRIVGGTEDGSRVAVGHVVPGGPADGLLRPGDLLTSVDGAALAGATHARAVAAVFQAAARGHVTLGVRHNRADIQSLGLAGGMSHHASPHGAHQPPMSGGGSGQHSYSIVHPAPLYPPHPALAPHPSYHHQQPHQHSGVGAVGGWRYEVEEAGGGAGAAVPYDVTVARAEGEGFGFVVISSTNKATSTIGQLIPNSPAARCGLLRVGDTILAINHAPVHHLPHPDVVALIKQSARTVTLTVQPAD